MIVILLLAGFCVQTTSYPYAYSFIEQNMTWTEAQTFCTSQYTALAQINSMEDLNTMMSSSSWGYKGKTWIGLSATPRWTWVDGQLATSLLWISGWSDDNNMCVTTKSGWWKSVSCSLRKYSVCFDGTNYNVVLTAMTWSEAQANCKSQASNLAKITDGVTNTLITTELVLNEAWIGLKSTWLWQWSDTGNKYTFSNWQPGQPNNLNGQQNCAAVGRDGSWTDEQCNAQYPFFCYETYKSRTTLVKMKIQSRSNMDDPASLDSLLKQLHAALTNRGVADFVMTWSHLQVHQMEEKTGDAC